MPTKTNKNKQKTQPKISRSVRFRVISIVGILLFAGVGTYIIQASQASNGQFVKVAVHPQASQQPTADGKTLSVLKEWNGKLYAGFGDGNANTGPIAITPFDGTTFANTPELLADTECIDLFRVLSGKLFVPSCDPKNSSDYAVATSAGGVNSWQNPTVVNSTHNFEMTTLTGDDLWIIGSQGNNAVAWRSLDGGTTWQNMITIQPPSLTDGSYSRFSGAIVVGGKLYVQAYDNPNFKIRPLSRVFDGTSWTDGPNLSYFYNASPFNGLSIYTGYNGTLQSFDGRTIKNHTTTRMADYYVDGTTVYVMDTNKLITKSTDLVNWSVVATAPAVASSIGTLNQVLYIGGTDSTLYRYDTASTPVDTISPTVTITAPVNNATVSRTVRISASSSDNIKVTKLDLYIDNVLVTSSSNGAISYSWKTNSVSRGPHSLTVKGFDAAGNTSSNTVTVTR